MNQTSKRIPKAFFAVDDARRYLEVNIVPHIELEDPEAEAAFHRNFADHRLTCNPDGSTADFKPSALADKLSVIREVFHLTSEHAGDLNAAHAWWALQAAAFVVQQDLLKLAQYATELEAENRRLRTAR